MSDIDPNRLAFLQGVLAGLASSGQVIHYDEVRRLCRLADPLLSSYLAAARQKLAENGQPDFCAIVVNESGWPGGGWGDLEIWPAELRRAHNFWRDRRRHDNDDFRALHGDVPAVPGLP